MKSFRPSIVGCFLVSLLIAPFHLRAETPQVTPIDWSRFKGMEGVDPKDELGKGLVQILQNESRYMLKWLTAEHKVRTDLEGWEGVPCYYPVFPPKWKPADGWEETARPQSHISWAVAALIRTGAYSPEVAGMSEDEAVKRIELAIRGDAFMHVANTKSELHWGDMWQSAYWSSELAEATWMLWDRMSDETKTAVAKMTEHEADRFINYEVPYYGDETGKVIRPGDTAAEENAWNSRILMAAVCMMPNHPNKTKWLTKACELMAGSYDRPQDMKDTTMVDGRPLKDWLHGYNALDIGLVVNHGRVHPDYCACIMEKCTAAIDCAFANRTTPQSAFTNVAITYDAMAEYQFKPGPSLWTKHKVVPPGGPMLRRSADGGYEPGMYYPEGADWTNVAFDNVILDVDAYQAGADKGKDFSCLSWAKARTAAIIKLQNRPGHDGNVYQDGDWKTPYRSTDAVSFQSLAEGWTMWWLYQHKMVPPIAPAF